MHPQSCQAAASQSQQYHLSVCGGHPTPPGTVMLYVSADSCQYVGWPGVHSMGPHEDNRLRLFESQDTCDPLARAWGGKDGQGSFDANPPSTTTSSSAFVLSCDCRTCSEILNSTARG